jgi:glycosyltransferase involved in cell wall biosynthesis
MKTLVWHWGKRGAGPLFAARLAAALNELPGHFAALSLAAGAELLAQPDAPACDWPEPTYETPAGYLAQRLAARFLQPRTRQHLAALQPDFAICAMPALLDQRMVSALRQMRIPYAIMVHDATAHPGETLKFRALGQPALLRHAQALFPLSSHVEHDLCRGGYGAHGQMLAKLWHPAFSFGNSPAALNHGGLPRILCFGRLLPYKGLDLLADALTILGPDLPFEVRICGDGPKSPDLTRLQAMKNVTVEHRWIPEAELPALLDWADAVVLPYREASQSGVAAAAIAQGRYVLATNVGGLPEQLAGAARASLCTPNAAAIAAGLQTLFTGPQTTPAPIDAAADWRAMATAMLANLAQLGAPQPARKTAPEVVKVA